MKTVLKPNTQWWKVNWAELWDYQDLLKFLVRRDITAIYKQTVLGPLWFVIQPLLTTVVFTIIFGNVAKISTNGTPHFIFYMSGSMFWNYFQGVLNQSAGSLFANTSMLTKVYFPRLIIPLSGVFVHLAHLALNMVLFSGFFVYFLFWGEGLEPNAWMWMLPLTVLQCAMLGLGFGLWVSSMTIKYRDLRFALPFLIQLWMYATPIVYPASLVVNPLYKIILWLNPMTAVVEFSRLGFTGQGEAFYPGLGMSWVATIVILFSGILIFNKMERNFVDTI